jgi:hypothetical protein
MKIGHSNCRRILTTILAILTVVAAILLASDVSFAALRTVPVVLIIASDENSPSSAQCRNIITQAVTRFPEVGVQLRVIRIVEVPDQYPEQRELKQQAARLDVWGSWARRNGYRSPRYITYFVLSPLRQGILYTGGMAKGRCSYRTPGALAFSYSTASMRNSYGAPRVNQSVTAFQHEIFHLLGASHRDSSPNLMSYTALGYVDHYYPLPILGETRNDIKKCLKRRTGTSPSAWSGS